MDERTTALVRLAASLAGGERGQVETMTAAAAADPVGAEEVLLQSHLFLGYPASLNALALWRRRTGRSPPEPVEDSPQSWIGRGEEVCRAVYAEQYPALRELMAHAHPDLDRWAVYDGYGKVLGRPGLGLRERELCAAAQLEASGATRQLHAHLRGCLNVGATIEEVETMRAAVRDLIDPERTREADRVWERVRARWTGKQGR
jgi:4-carboxymuconolactone decarboxylase